MHMSLNEISPISDLYLKIMIVLHEFANIFILKKNNLTYDTESIKVN